MSVARSQSTSAELEKLDPESVERANLFGDGFDEDDEDDEDDVAVESEAEGSETETEKEEAAADALSDANSASDANSSSDPLTVKVPVTVFKVPMENGVKSADENASKISLNIGKKTDVATSSDVAQTSGANVAGNPPVAAMVPYLELKIIFIPLVVSIVLFALLWSVVSLSLIHI